jgi:sugar/nucleoside kinase (ribokinase family)
MKVLSFGEAMIRFAPTEDQATPLRPSGKRDFVFTIAGDELNVCIALSRLDIASEWISVVPSNSHGQVVLQSAEEAHVEAGRVIVDNSPAAEIGTFFVVPEEKTVEYQVSTLCLPRITAFDNFCRISAPKFSFCKTAREIV